MAQHFRGRNQGLQARRRTQVPLRRARLYNSCFHILMNEARYASLPPDVKKAIDDTTGTVMVDRFGELWNKWDQAGLDAVKARGNVIVPVSNQQREQWRAQLQPLIDSQLAELQKEGVGNARAVYDEMLKKVAQYSNDPRGDDHPRALSTIAPTAARSGFAGAGITLLMLMTLVLMADISTRKTLNFAILGTIDLTQLAVMLAVFLALPLAFLHESNVDVDFFTSRLPPRALASLKCAVTLLWTALLIAIAWYSFEQAQIQYAQGDKSMTLGIPMLVYWAPVLFGTTLSIWPRCWSRRAKRCAPPARKPRHERAARRRPRFRRGGRADRAARAGGNRNGRRRHAWLRRGERLEHARFRTRARAVRVGVSDRALGAAAVHPDGRVRRAWRTFAEPVRLRRRADRSPARRARARHGRRLRDFRRGVRLRDRHGGHHGARGDARDAPRRLRRPPVLGLGRRGRHARGDDSAVDPVRDLRPDDRAIHRQAARRGNPAGHPRHAALHGGDRLVDRARPETGASGTARELARAAAGGARRLAGGAPVRPGAGRHVLGLVFTHRGRRGGRLWRDRAGVGGRQAEARRFLQRRSRKPRPPSA